MSLSPHIRLPTPPRVALAALLVSMVATSPALSQRTRSGLQAFYDFSSPSGNLVVDRSGVGQPLDLKISEPKNVRRTKGSLEVRGKTIIRSDQPATKLVNATKKTGELTIEAWLRPARTNQTGPARLVTLSKDGSNRNFTLGQDGDQYDVRLRTTRTSVNGLPSLPSRAKSLHPRLTHVVYTRDRGGKARIYLDGKLSAEKTVQGEPSNWDRSYRFALGNEHSMDRLWLGTYHLVAIYSRDLSPSEVAQHFKAGAGAASGAVARIEPDAKAVFFENRIAPILANHCLECHDPATRKGKLDLSTKLTAFAERKHGSAVVPGKPDDSELWESVVSDEMPEDKDPLTAQQKADLRKWIAEGATWSLDRIDPVNYLRGGKGDSAWVQRLTVDEYIATVRAAVGVDIESEALRILPPDMRADGFSNTAYNLSIDLKHIDAYAQLASMIVGRMDVRKFAEQFSRSRKFTDKDMGALLSGMGRWLLRGPLEEHEIITFRGISTSVASAGGTFDEAIGLIVEAMLQSPRFIYRIENQRGDGSAWPVGDYELASRMSYILWGAPPDQELLRAADQGELTDTNDLNAQISRMLKDPRAVTRSRQFASEWLNLGRLANLQPDPGKYPNWNPQLATDMREETLAYFEEVVWKEKRPLSDLLNAQFTFVTPRLADHYAGRRHLPTAASRKEGLTRRDLSALRERGGLLTQGSVLTIGGDEASMVTRGLFVMDSLLRGVVKAPPPGTDTTPIPPRPGLSHRGAAQQRIDDKSCGGCHSKFEPLAFGLEKFDGLGTFHEKDHHGNELREDGEILFPGEAAPVKFGTSAELMDLLAKSPRVGESLTWKITQFSLGRPLDARDARAVAGIHKSAQQAGGTYASVVTALILSDLVRMTRTEG